MASSERVSWVYREQSKRDSVVIIRQLFCEGRQDFPSLSLGESVISAFGWLLFYPGSCWADKCPVSTFHVVSSSPAAPISSPSPFPLSEGSWGKMGSCWGPGEGQLQPEAGGQAGASSGGVAVGIHVIYGTQVLALICVQSRAVTRRWSPPGLL